MAMVFTIVGYLAGTLTTVAFLPQVLRTYRTKSMGDIDGATLVAFTLGVILWIVYGVYVHSWPVIVANGVTLGLQIMLLAMKARYRAAARR